VRSFRSKPIGWQRDSYRHYLAAKGISTCRYPMTKERAKEIAEGVKSFFSDGRAETPDFSKMQREAQVQEEYARTAQELSNEEQEGKLQSGASERFLEGDFTNETKDFLDKKIDYGQYRNNLNRLMKKHKEQRSCTFDVFTWK
jgi:hypothetical protein